MIPQDGFSFTAHVRRPALCGLLVVGLLLPLPLATGGEGDALRFEVHSAGGPARVAPLGKLSEDWSVRLGGARPALVPRNELVALRREATPLPAHPRGPQVVFANGDRVPLHPDAPLKLAKDVLRFRPQGPLRVEALELSVPAARVALIWLNPPDSAEDVEVQLRRLLDRRRNRDVLLLRNGDQIDGTITDLDRGSMCRLQVGKKSVQVPFGRIAVVAFNTDLLDKDIPRQLYGHLVLSDGCRLGLASARLEAGKPSLLGKTLFGGAVAVDATDVVALDVRQGAAVYLSDLTPRSYEHTPFLGQSWPYRKDASVAGRALRLAGGSFDKGLGMHSQSRITYSLERGYRWFEAEVGLDELTGQKGQARIQVLLDGKAAPGAAAVELSGREPPVRLRLDVSQARELTLLVQFARYGDVQAHVNWADARLIK